MHRVFLALLLALVAAAPAHALRGWTAPVFTSATDGAVAADGTSVVGSLAGDVVIAQVDDGPSVTFPSAATAARVAAADGGVAIVAYMDGAGNAFAAIAADRRFAGLQHIGRGLPTALAVAPDGSAAALVTEPGGRSTLAVRPPDEHWGAPQPLSGPVRSAVILTPAGEAVTDPVALTGGAPATLALDGTGRVLAAWATDDAVHTAVRTAGVWRPATDVAVPTTPGPPQLGTARDGSPLIVWRDAEGRLYALAGTDAPVLLDDHPGGGAPALAVAPDGSALVAYSDVEGALRVVRREGTEAFGPSQIVTCTALATAPAAGLSAAGDALLVAPPVILRDTPEPSAEPRCGAGKPTAFYAFERVVAGVPVAITVTGAGPVGRLVRTFRRPGRARWTYRAADGTTQRFSVKVYARSRLRAVRAGATIRVRANAFAATGRARVALLVLRGRTLLAKRTLRLGARPRTVRLPVAPGGRQKVQLIQEGSVEAEARVRSQ